jgi:tetratricopeptide (TPR) repeat protein
MVNDRARWARLVAMAGLLLALGVSARGGLRPARDTDTFATVCELNPLQEAAALERCLALQPRDIEIMLDLGSIYEAGGAFDRAEALYRRALAVDAKDGDVHVRLGRLLLRRGDRAGAADAARTALAYQPRSARAIELLSQSAHAGTQ